MKRKIFGLAAAAALAMTAVAGGSASATTLEWAGVAQNKTVGISATATEFIVLSTTSGSPINSCAASSILGQTSVFTGAKVTAGLSEFKFTSCNFPITVDNLGQLYFEWESGTTSASVFSENAKLTSGTPYGFSITCETSAGTKIGTLTGATTASNPGTEAILHLNAVLNCGFLVPSATLKGTYKLFGNELGAVS
jgi:hypothetical protein